MVSYNTFVNIGYTKEKLTGPAVTHKIKHLKSSSEANPSKRCNTLKLVFHQLSMDVFLVKKSFTFSISYAFTLGK